MNAQDIKTKISAHLSRFFPAQNLADDDDIFSLGFVNSMFALQLVNFVEHEFGIEIDNEDMELANFRSVAALLGLVQRKTAIRAAT